MASLSSSDETLRRFLETQDLSLLEKPILFNKTSNFNRLTCCMGAFMGCASAGLTCIFCPIGTFAPWTMFNRYSLRLDKDSVVISTAMNDFCCHVATSLKTVPLEKIQDVELQESCIHTCFGLKQVSVQTAGMGTPVPEVAAAFLAAPEAVREAIQLAVKLYRQRALGPPGQQQGMQRTGGAGGGAAEAWPAVGSLLQRLQCLDQLVSRGVLSSQEAESIKVAVLAAEHDPTRRLVEAADLRDRQLLSAAEFDSLRASLLSQIKRDGKAGQDLI